MYESLKKVKASELEKITLWHVAYSDMVKHELRVASYELRVKSLKS